MSASGRYRHLFTPLRLGPVTVSNRIVFSAHLTNYATDGMPTEQHAAYYAARAAGGAGLIITEEHSTHPTDWPYEKLIHGFHPGVVDGYRRITDAVHAHDVPIFAQLNHNGGQASSHVLPPAGVGAEPGARPALPRGPEGRRAPRDRRDRRRLRHRRRPLRGRGVRRGRAPVLPLLHRPRLPLPGHQPAHRRVRRQPGRPGPPAARDRRRRAVDHRVGPGARRAPLRRRADRGRHRDRRRRRGGPDGRGHRARSTTSTPRSAWPRPRST